MDLETPYAFGRIVPLSYAETEKKVRDELLKEGFGVLSSIDVKEKFREKLQKDFRNYVILGACNPAMAWEAFGKDLDIGTLLPCNVVVYTNDEGQSVVMVMDPVAALSVIGNPELNELAGKVKEKMERMLKAL